MILFCYFDCAVRFKVQILTDLAFYDVFAALFYFPVLLRGTGDFHSSVVTGLVPQIISTNSVSPIGTLGAGLNCISGILRGWVKES